MSVPKSCIGDSVLQHTTAGSCRRREARCPALGEGHAFGFGNKKGNTCGWHVWWIINDVQGYKKAVHYFLGLMLRSNYQMGFK